MDRGHRILLDKGLQIQAVVGPTQTSPGSFNLANWEESNFTTVNLGKGVSPYYLGNSPGIPWGRWLAEDYTMDPLYSVELTYMANMVSIQISDEENLADFDQVDEMAIELAYWRANYPNLIGYTDQTPNGAAYDYAVEYYMATAQPDMLMIQYYAFFDDPPPVGGSPTELYRVLEQTRTRALRGHDWTGNRPIPCGAYIQTYYYAPSHPDWRDMPPSDSETRLNQFAAWTFGYKFVASWIWNQLTPTNLSLFFADTDNGDDIPTAAFYQIKETNRQSRNLGPTLVRLLSTDTRIVRGEHKEGAVTVENDRPVGVYELDDATEPPSHSTPPRISAISATNLGTTNDGLRGDVFIGYFKPLLEEDDGPSYTDEEYFMILNGLTGAFSTCAETRQSIRIDFDFESTGVTQLQRRSRDTGLVEDVPLISDGGALYHLILELDGGTADLFKFNTGAPFITGTSTGLWTDVTYESVPVQDNVNGGTDEEGYYYTSDKPSSGAWTCDYDLAAGTSAMDIFSAKYIKFESGAVSAENLGDLGLRDNSLVLKIALSDYVASATWTPISFYRVLSEDSSVELKYSMDGANFTTCYTSPSGSGYVDPGTLSLPLSEPAKILYIAYVGTIGDGSQAYWSAEGGSLTFTADPRSFDEWTDVIYENVTVKSQVNAGADTGGYSYTSNKPGSGAWTEDYSLNTSIGPVNIWSAINAGFTTEDIGPRQFGQIQDSAIIIRIDLSDPINSFTWDPDRTYYATATYSSAVVKYSVDGQNFTPCFTIPGNWGGYFDQTELTFPVHSTKDLYIGWFGTLSTGSTAYYAPQSTGTLTFTLDPAPVPATCLETTEFGYSLDSDFDQNCYVDLLDLMSFVSEWRQCINPADEECDLPW